jgi:hypothetical protein
MIRAPRSVPLCAISRSRACTLGFGQLSAALSKATSRSPDSAALSLTFATWRVKSRPLGLRLARGMGGLRLADRIGARANSAGLNVDGDVQKFAEERALLVEALDSSADCVRVGELATYRERLHGMPSDDTESMPADRVIVSRLDVTLDVTLR